ncbi:MAG: hypothetical protein M1816_007715 [Peltula sp. TS41687]|nr:MAG: hypothetical protein M1816_007715 [Peltula sp. TS41687]
MGLAISSSAHRHIVVRRGDVDDSGADGSLPHARNFADCLVMTVRAFQDELQRDRRLYEDLENFCTNAFRNSQHRFPDTTPVRMPTKPTEKQLRDPDYVPDIWGSRAWLEGLYNSSPRKKQKPDDPPNAHDARGFYSRLAVGILSRLHLSPSISNGPRESLLPKGLPVTELGLPRFFAIP